MKAFYYALRYFLKAKWAILSTEKARKSYFWVKIRNEILTTYSSLNQISKVLNEYHLSESQKNKEMFVFLNITKLVSISRIPPETTVVGIYLPFKVWWTVMSNRNNGEFRELYSEFNWLNTTHRVFIMPLFW